MKTINFIKNLAVCLIFPAYILFSSNLFAGQIAAKNGMVVTGHPVASQFGVEILKSGGNAIDAAVAAAIIAGVAEPHASGIGGGGAMLIYLQEQDSLSYINYYQQTPALLPGAYDPARDNDQASSVLVPGTIAGLHFALTNYGTIQWKDLLHLAADKMEAGFRIDDHLHGIILDSYEKLLKYPETRQIYLPNDLPPASGEYIQNVDIIITLRKLANFGPEVFYRGDIADSIETVILQHGGTLRKTDLNNYKVRQLSPLRGNYRDYTIYSAPPPQSGLTIIETLNILEFKKLSEMGNYTKFAASFHFMAEAMKRAYADRLTYLSDPLFVDVPTDVLINKEFARSRFEDIDFSKANPAQPKKTKPGDIRPLLSSDPDDKGCTTHISVVDAQGNAVSLTQTLNRFWGCGITVGGFLLNNGMTSFSGGNSVNRIEPNKQPRSTISPTLIFKNNRLFMVIGSPGAGAIISTLVEVICQIVDFNKTPEAANQAPRFCSRKWSDNLPLESNFSPALIDSLITLGHPIRVMNALDSYFGGVQLIVVDFSNGELIGSSDPRRSGTAIGY
ncbi:MAG TPA: gamma-glutamyltransferase [bacterium]|nr:gamma-glutamyltransferase [bacterium]